MLRPLLMALVLVVAPACGNDPPPPPDNSAQEALAQEVEDLGRELDALRTHLEGTLEDQVEGTLEDQAADAKRISMKLRRSIKDLKSALADVRAGSDEAADAAAAAAVQISSVARQLRVLEERYDFHLRRYHGGG